MCSLYARAFMKRLRSVLLALAMLLAAPAIASAATCADFPNQAAAQAAANTRDADGDGIYCESLPCPCARPGAATPATGPPSPLPVPAPLPVPPTPVEPSPTPTPSLESNPTAKPTPEPAPGPKPKAKKKAQADTAQCRREKRTVSISFSRTKYRNVRAHWVEAVLQGYPRVLTIRRQGADERRRKLLAGIATETGKDRDEYPPAVARSTVRASVKLVPSSESRSHDAAMGVKLRRWCSGQRFKVVWF